MSKVTIIINEQHSLLEEQEQILNKTYTTWEKLLVPASGWTIEEIKEVAIKLEGVVIFVSPIPVLIKWLSEDSEINGYNKCPAGYYNTSNMSMVESVKIFHNDKREKKELPNGRIISVTAETGWQLI